MLYHIVASHYSTLHVQPTAKLQTQKLNIQYNNSQNPIAKQKQLLHNYCMLNSTPFRLTPLARLRQKLTTRMLRPTGDNLTWQKLNEIT